MTEAVVRKDRGRLVLPAILFALALLLRLFGIGWGLKNDLHNQSYHPDEPLIWAVSQQLEPAKLHLTPGFYNYGTLYLTVLKVTSDMTGAYTGTPDGKDPDALWAYVSRCHLAGRIVSAVAGAGTVLVVFLMMRRFLGDFGASIGAAAILVAPAHVVHSRFQTVDVFATFLLAVGAYFALRLIPVGKEEAPPKVAMRWVILSALFVGLSAGTKYTGILGLLSLWMVLFLCRRSTFLKDAAVSLGVAILSFLVATPGALLETQAFLRDVGFEMSHTAEGHGLVFAGTANGYLYHFANLMSGIGVAILFIGLAGLVYAAYRKQYWVFALLAFFLPYYFLIGGATDKYMRYTFPLYIAIAAGFGFAMVEGHRKQGMGLAVVLLGLLGLGGVFDGRGLMGAGKDTQWMMNPDPRDAAARYLKEAANAKPDTVVGLPSDPWYWSPPLFPDSTCLRSVPFSNRMELMQRATHPRVAYFVEPGGSHHPYDSRLITETKPDYVAISSLEMMPRERLSRRTGLGDEASVVGEQFKQFWLALTRDYVVDRQFGSVTESVEDMQYIQPIVWIWKRKDEKPATPP